MTVRRLTLAITTGLALGAASQAAAQPVLAEAPPVFPWYLDPVEIGPLTAQDGDTARPLYTYAGDEDAGDFAARYGCKPVWDGGINRYVPACNAH